MMILKLHYVFAPLFCFFLFCKKYSWKFHFLYILLDILVGITPLHLNKKVQKINRHLVDKVKPLMFSTRLKIFLTILMIILKIDVTLKHFWLCSFLIIA